MHEGLKKRVFNCIVESEDRWTLPTLLHHLSQIDPAPKTEIKNAIRQLVNAGALTWVYEHGCSFIERSFAGPVPLSKRVIIKPPHIRYDPRTDEIVVKLHPGASFGNGRHPTTRLAVRGLDDLLSENSTACAGKMKDILDIGSGSGVLLITALHLGVEKGIGIDTDPCARAETLKNIHANGFSGRGEAADGGLSSFRQPFSLVTANLRLPSLLKLSQKIASLIEDEGFAVLSGIKTEEVEDLKIAYRKNGFMPVWERSEKGWAAVVLQKLRFEKRGPKT